MSPRSTIQTKGYKSRRTYGYGCWVRGEGGAPGNWAGERNGQLGERFVWVVRGG
ncbi:hypothetical protein DAPPUDRAFT_302069 [Daphnia pulex]|uniref:Uncharacterized protein n=1 Tax=Daphnia pulex TaxID=6669 RepID=E9GBI5_DAPPU|nr:hypothetical protein DAPPUDRAFT_302069 [Daphnia pulex]|eukprot:EFX82962.1 hypothetical protein DAPPUDRAFT_302069 [Daphnia pulex]